MRILILFSLLLSYSHLFANHNRAGEISFIRTGDFSIQATIRTYTKASIIPADRDSLEICWGDGMCDWVLRTNGVDGNADGVPDGEILGYDVKYNAYIGTHNYSGYGEYVLSMNDPNRNEGILNVNAPNSVNVPFHTENEFSLLEEYDNSPIMLENPIYKGAIGETFYHIPNAYDADGDSIAYRMITPLRDVGTPVPNYQLVTEFPLGGSTFSLDETSGLMKWETPQIAGEYAIAIEVLSYRDGVQIGRMIRDMSINVYGLVSAGLPDLVLTQFVPDEINTVEVGEEIEFLIFAEDLNNTDELNLEVTSGLYDPMFSEAPQFFVFFQNETVVEANFSWQVKAEHVRDQPYQVVFKVVDDFGLVNFAVVRFKVVDVTNVEEIEIHNQLILYPNPCQDNLFLAQEEKFIGQQYEIWDAVGRKIQTGRISGNGAIDVVGIRNGVYIVKLEDGGVGRFLKNSK